ncbi:MAG: hypothetical protein SFV81_17590 [Pirellulaceae bacterium]|nr:hypothetical protein [Pirellulaceae bacterium]
MSSSANVRSLERLEGFLEHCQSTRAKLLKELENLQLELQRLTSWLENDAARYWAGELQRAQRDWVECEQALLRCRSAVRASEQRPCTEQRKRLEQATERRTLCEQQVRFIREATLMWQREKTKIDAKIFRCRDLADSDLTVAINKLKEQLGRLEEYSTLRSGAVTHIEATRAESAAAGESTATEEPAADPQEPSP